MQKATTTDRPAAWLTLVRVPNLLTVPGDPLAGFLLFGGAGLARSPWYAMPAVLSSLCLYAAGLILNDLADLGADRIERPERPLPGGRISPHAALLVALILISAALVSASIAGREALIVAALLVVCILGYDFLLKEIPVVGAVCMGSCRGLSLLLGAAAAGGPGDGGGIVLAAAIGLALYISAVTVVAGGETSLLSVKWANVLPLAALILCLGGVMPWVELNVMFMVAALATLVWTAFVTLQLLRHLSPAAVQAAVGGFIRGLLLLQCSLLLVRGAAGLAPAIVLILFWPVNSWLNRYFNAA